MVTIRSPGGKPVSKMAALLAFSVFALIAGASANCDGVPNNYTIWAQVNIYVCLVYALTLQKPQFVTNISNGLLFVADAGQTNSLRIAHLYGSAYEMGFAHGKLFHDDIIRFYSEFQDYVDEMIAPYVKNLPQVHKPGRFIFLFSISSRSRMSSRSSRSMEQWLLCSLLPI